MIQLCPVCNGRGSVRHDFYNPYGTTTSPDVSPITCKRCNGMGTLIGFDLNTPPVITYGGDQK